MGEGNRIIFDLLLQPDPSYLAVQWLFLKLLAIVYLIAFWSLKSQLLGLYGRQGLLPIGVYLTRIQQSLGRKGLLRIPSLFWFKSDDRFLSQTANAGLLCSLLLLLGLWPPLLLLLLWLLYLSFVSVGRDFLSFQWDALLLETGFMSIFFALVTPPSLLMIVSFWVFCCRFLLSAGIVKLSSGDPNWRRLRALDYHYWTQPLPNRLAWYAHQLPRWCQRLSTLGTFFFELLVPLLFLAPAPLRLLGFLLSIAFQLMLTASGNFGFFNLLTITLLVPLLDASYLWPLQELLAPLTLLPDRSLLIVLLAPVFLSFILLNSMQLFNLFIPPLPRGRLMQFLSSWMISNPYGLFAVMTTQRLEFEIEGSCDGQQWQRYRFRWKPGDPARPPRQVAPHMPRLDWQMWFAALNPQRLDPWLATLLQRLLEGSTEVSALLQENPFKETPPTLIRLLLYRYQFTDRVTRRANGAWWKRNLIEELLVVSLKSDQKKGGLLY
ncbi:lipase maturation factor family protein [Malonomonas rubra]|uniref:lipase maturation factor family protein n=1 Tax=Malonomonas rubra TaxID=57040 RepID=UPI0026EE0C94|nr:lipase maturation factor family protein [Malonomonas rubra]